MLELFMLDILLEIVCVVAEQGTIVVIVTCLMVIKVLFRGQLKTDSGHLVIVSTMVDNKVAVVNDAGTDEVLFRGDTIVEVNIMLVIGKDELLWKNKELLLDDVELHGGVLELKKPELDNVETNEVESTEIIVESEEYVLKDVVPLLLLSVVVRGHQVVYTVVISVMFFCDAEDELLGASVDEFCGLTMVEDELMYEVDVENGIGTVAVNVAGETEDTLEVAEVVSACDLLKLYAGGTPCADEVYAGGMPCALEPKEAAIAVESVSTVFNSRLEL